jgi:uncharacterized membrane protein YhhN
MPKSTWIFVFIFLLLANLTSVYLNNDTLRSTTKPLLMPVLAIYFLTQTRGVVTPLKPWIILALSFSWLGDMFLMFEQTNSIFFLLGLSAFFIAQVFYIVFFHNIRMREYIRGNALLLLVVIVYYFILISIISPHLGDLKLPVRIYGVVLSFMVMLAMHTMFSKNKRAGRWMMIGAILFVTSDSVLAFNKFYSSFDLAGVTIMLTYGVAQLFLTGGAATYIREKAVD